MDAPPEPSAPGANDPQLYKYAAFISYKRDVDGAVAREVMQALETYTIPVRIRKETGSKRCGRVFKDEEELDAASSLSGALTDALTASKFLIVVCSPEARDSAWIKLEIEHFISLGREARILAALVRGEPSESFPPALQLAPLAVDLRGRSPRARRRRLEREKLRLLARIIGCDFDALVRRDAQRSVSRLRIAAIGAATVAAAAVAVLVYVIKLRAVSEERRVTAEARLSAASLAMDRINNLIGNRLNAGLSAEDLKPELVRLVADTQATLSITGGAGRDERLIQMSTHLNRAEIAAAHSDFKTATEEYRTSLVLGEAALASAPGDLPLRQDVAVSHSRLAQLATKNGDKELARNELVMAIQETETLLKEAPENHTIRGNLSELYVVLGEQQEADKSSQAPEAYAKAVAVGGIKPDDLFFLELARPVLKAHRHLGAIYRANGARDEALAEYKLALTLAETGFLTAPSEFLPRERIADYMLVGRILGGAQRYGDAVRSLDKGMVLLGQYRADHPQSTAAASDEWRLAGEIAVYSAWAGEGELPARLRQYDQVDDAVQQHLDGSTEEASYYILNGLDFSDRLLGAQQPAAAAAVARRVLALLNRGVFAGRPWPAGTLLFIRSMETLLRVLDPGEVTAAAHREVRICDSRRHRASEVEGLRCGSGLILLGTAAAVTSDVKHVGGYVDRVVKLSKDLTNEESADVLRCRVMAAHLGTSFALAMGAPGHARELNGAAVSGARKLVAIVEHATGHAGEEVDSELLGAALVLSASLDTGDDQNDARLALLREATTRLSTADRHLGALLLVATKLALIEQLIGRSEIAEARAEIGAAQGIVSMQAPPEPSPASLRWFAMEWRLTQVAGKLAVAAHDKAECERVADVLSKMAGAMLALSPQAATLQTGAKAAHDDCMGMP